jgi:hypothetical protein
MPAAPTLSMGSGGLMWYAAVAVSRPDASIVAPRVPLIQQP